MLKPARLAAAIALMACLPLQACAQDDSPAPELPPAEASTSSDPAPLRTIVTDVLDVEGAAMGTLVLTQGPHGVLLRVQLNDGALEPGWHGLHLHQTGDCSDTGVFKLSGGHVGKVAGGHGLLNPNGPEGGDTPNIYAHSSGAAAMEIITSRVTLDDLADEDGSALIIHAGPDDHITQPIGGAGARVACAVIK